MVFRRGLITAGGLSLLWMVGCGAPSSDKVPGQESRAAIAGSNQSATSQNNNQGTGRPGFSLGVSQGASTERSTQEPGLIGKTDEDTQPTDPNLPESIAKDLASPDARLRFQALDHWGSKGNTVSLDPVFEAMEDEDEEVREKATAIVEQYWAAEQEKERG